MKKIILDSNFLIDCLKFKVNFLEEIKRFVEENFEILILENVLKELEKMSKRRTRESKYAKLALKIVKEKNFKIVSTSFENTDEAIISSSDENTIVATNDIELRKTLKAYGIKNIYLRAKKYLEIR